MRLSPWFTSRSDAFLARIRKVEADVKVVVSREARYETATKRWCRAQCGRLITDAVPYVTNAKYGEDESSQC